MGSACFADHAMAGNQIGYRILGEGPADGARAIGFANGSGYILVAGHRSRRDRQQCLPDLHLEVGAFEQKVEWPGLSLDRE